MSSPIRSICGSLRKQVDVNGNTINITSSEWIVANPEVLSLGEPACITKCMKNGVVSMGRRNTQLRPTFNENKS